MLENISLSFQSVWSHKVRSFLTMLGIIIGIASIITIVSTIKGTNEQIKQNLIGSGVNAVVVSVYQDDYQIDMTYQNPGSAVLPITEETRASLEELPGVKTVSLYSCRSWGQNIYYKNTAFNGSLYGIDEYYFDVYGYKVALGRGFNEADSDGFHKVCLIDQTTAETLFPGQNPVGEVLEIAGEPFVVIGVIEQSAAFTPVINSISDYYMYANNSSGKIFVPHSIWPMIGSFDEPQFAAVGTYSTDDMTRAGQAVADALTESQVTDSTYSYRSEDILEQAQQLQEMSTSTNRQLIWIAGISLIVGGIGVMNIMLVTVTERTREIGLKKAIGAKKRRILFQFLTEAGVLTSLGGILGCMAGIALSKLLSGLVQTPSAVSIPSIVIAVAFSMVIGLLFGLLPAIKAANMNPIDALRRE